MDTTLWSLIRSDISRYSYMTATDATVSLKQVQGPLIAVRALVICQGLQASITYRIGHALVEWSPSIGPTKIVKTLCRIAHFVASRVVESYTGISIAERAQIGPGLYIGHFGGVIIGAVSIGENCNISHGVTLGRSGRVGSYERPRLGDRVWVGPGAVITGSVEIGDDSVVGANAVVTHRVPPRSAAYGVPARIQPGTASFDLVVYPGSETDAARLASKGIAEGVVVASPVPDTGLPVVAVTL